MSRSGSVDGCVLEVDRVTKRYGDNVVVEDLTFSVPPGRVTGFLGPDGSGKSTLGLAAALLARPDVLILDEPGNGLDPQGTRTLRDLLRAHAADGGTVLVSSHVLAGVEHLVDDVIVINHGRLVNHGALADLQQTASLVRPRDADRLAVILEREGASTTTPADHTLVVRGMVIDEIGDRAFTNGIALNELSPHAGSLEELFLSWTSDPATPDHEEQPCLL